MKITIFNLVLEMQSFVNVSDEIYATAKYSKVNTDNNQRFRDLVANWAGGVYDEDPDYVISEIKSILF